MFALNVCHQAVLPHFASVTSTGSYDSEDASYGRRTRRTNLSPTPSSGVSYTETYSDEDSYEEAEVDAALNPFEDIEEELDDVLTSWSRPPSTVGQATYATYTGATSTLDTMTSSDPYAASTSYVDRNARVLSTISERTENPSSRPTSFAQSGGTPGSRPVTQYSTNSANIRRSAHIRSQTEHSTPNRPLTPGRIEVAPTRSTGELIAFFEEKKSSGEVNTPTIRGHTRTTSVPIGPRSPSPYSTITNSQTMPTTGFTTSLSGFGFGFGSITGYGSTTGYGTSTGYGSRPSSPTKSRYGSSLGSELVSPNPRPASSVSSDSRFTPSSSFTRTGTGAYSSSYSGSATNSNTFTSTFTSASGTVTPTASSIRRPQRSPRSPTTSVRNIVSAWKERTPSLSKSKAPSSSPPASGEGLFRRRSDRMSAPLDPRRNRALPSIPAEPSTPKTSTESLSVLDVEDLGQYASKDAPEVSSLTL